MTTSELKTEDSTDSAYRTYSMDCDCKKVSNIKLSRQAMVEYKIIKKNIDCPHCHRILVKHTDI